MYISKSLRVTSNHFVSILLISLLAACGGGGTSNEDVSVASHADSVENSLVASSNFSRENGKKVRAPLMMVSPTPTTTTPCSYTDWKSGQSYAFGAIVRYPANGNYYKAKYDNPGYDPTISTWFWEPVINDCAAPAPACSFPDWTAGKWYVAGTILRYPANGNFYRASSDNPGYDPTISTWYWQSHTCSSTTTQTPTATSNGLIVTEAQFNQMFPNRNSFYTYAGLVAAMSSYQAIFNSGTDTIKKQEAAAFLANVNHETGGLQYIREINQANWSHYCQAGGQYPCASDQQYYGRGPIQLSWNYNYGAAGQALGLNLLADPDMIARDATVAWKTAMWFWMTQSGAGSMTANRAMVDSVGFGETIRTINGGLECNKAVGSVGNQQMQMRVEYYQKFTQILGVAAGSNLTC